MQSLILECAVRAFLIAIFMGAILGALRVKAARARHAVWTSVVVLMLALPVWTAWGPKAVVRVLNPVAASTTSLPIVSTDAFSAPVPAPTPPVRGLAWTWQSILPGIYLLGFFVLLARLVIGTVRAHLLVRRAAKLEGRLTAECAVLAPVTVGWLKPTVILPAHWRRWPQAQLDAVLTHEGEHARWRDPLVQWLALLNRAVFWFHPLAWWLERRLSGLSEEACDAAVLARGHDRFAYSEYLLEIARALQQAGPRVNVMGMAMPGAFLPRRLRRILEGRPAPRISRVRLACVAAACAVVSTVFTAGAMDHAQAVASSKPQNRSLTIAAPFAAEPSPQAPAHEPKVLLAQAQTSPAKPNAAPQNGGSISGTVEDPSGSRVPGCLIVLHDQGGAEVQSVRSDAAGRYQFSSIAPGHYNVEYQMHGFAILKKDADIKAGQPVRIDAMLLVGQMSETITVIGQKPPSAEPGRISVGGRVEAARLIAHVDPVYPPELRQRGIEGTVRIEAVISSDGVPGNLRVLNIEVNAGLAEAALDAVRQWRYQPTKLNEHPVATATKIDVIFELGK
jgi:TonB family protein